MESVKIKEISRLNQSHGDHLVLCFVSFHNLKTYAYLSLKQLAIVEKDFTVEFLTEIAERPTWQTEKKARENKFILNIGLLYLLNQKSEWLLKSAKSNFNAFKKLPIAQLLLSDKPEIFHEHKTTYSYKNIAHFRFSDFSKMREQSMAIKMWQISKVSELAQFLFGVSDRTTNKLSLEVILQVNKEDIQVDFYFVRFILMVRQFLSSEELIKLISSHKEIKNSSFYKKHWHSYIYSGLDKTPEGMLTFFNNVKEYSQKKRILLNWNVPSHIMDNFDKVMDEAYPKFTLDLDKTSDALYFYNNLSRDYGRLFIKDFKLKHCAIFKQEIKLLDNKKTGSFILKVPKTYQELVQWGSALNNCAGNFDQIDHYSQGLVVGVFKDNKLKYLIDYREKYGRAQITQLKGFKNCEVDSESSFQEIVTPFLENNLVQMEDLESLKDE